MTRMLYHTLIAILAGATEAQFGVGQGVDINYQSGPKQPNVTGNFPFSGFDLSRPFPGTTMDGWSFDVQVTADIPAKVYGSENSGFVTLSSIYITPPSGNISSVDGSWELCAHYIGRAKAAGDDGSCSKALSEDCVSGLNYHAAVNSTVGGECYMILPTVCKPSLTTDARVDGGK